MDERRSQFIIALGRLFADARLAALTVRVTLDGGAELVGVPTPPAPGDGPTQIDDTGYEDAVTIDGTVVPMSQVVEVRVYRP